MLLEITWNSGRNMLVHESQNNVKGEITAKKYNVSLLTCRNLKTNNISSIQTR